jgi:inner membrane protein
MDPITHAALGTTCALALTKRRELRRAAALVGLCAGLLPDVDIFFRSSTDPLFSLEYHRHFTHSVVFAPVIALLTVWFVYGSYRLCGRKIEGRKLLAPATVAALSHGFCDVWTSHGTRSWWPFSDQRVTLDWISVIDPVLTVPLLVTAVLAWVLGSQRTAWVALGGVALYLALCQVQKSRAQEALQQWVETEGLSVPDRSTVKPSFGNILVWRGMVVHGQTFRAVAIRCGMDGVVKIMAGESQTMFQSAEEAAEALGVKPDSVQWRAVKRFAHFSDGWIGVHPGDPLTLGDLRYASMPNEVLPLWGIRLNPQSPDEPVQLSYFREIKAGDLEKFWALIKGEGWGESQQR